MAVDVSVVIEGIDGMRDELDRLSARYGAYDAANTLYATLRRATKDLRKTIERRTPRRTGKLAATVAPAWITVDPKAGASTIQARVGWRGLSKTKEEPRLLAALAIEYGNRRQTARPVLQRALGAHRQQIVQSIIGNIVDDVADAEARLAARKGKQRVS